MVLATDPPTYWFDPTRPESRIARLEVDAALQHAAGRADALVAPQHPRRERARATSISWCPVSSA